MPKVCFSDDQYDDAILRLSCGVQALDGLLCLLSHVDESANLKGPPLYELLAPAVQSLRESLREFSSV